MVNEKVNVIKNLLTKTMPDRSIKYKYSNETSRDLHKFRIEAPQKPTHWLYLNRECVDDNESSVLANLVNTSNIVEIYYKSPKSKWLLLSMSGIQEVDEQFAKS